MLFLRSRLAKRQEPAKHTVSPPVEFPFHRAGAFEKPGRTAWIGMPRKPGSVGPGTSTVLLSQCSRNGFPVEVFGENPCRGFGHSCAVRGESVAVLAIPAGVVAGVLDARAGSGAAQPHVTILDVAKSRIKFSGPLPQGALHEHRGRLDDVSGIKKG